MALRPAPATGSRPVVRASPLGNSMMSSASVAHQRPRFWTQAAVQQFLKWLTTPLSSCRQTQVSVCAGCGVNGACPHERGPDTVAHRVERALARVVGSWRDPRCVQQHRGLRWLCLWLPPTARHSRHTRLLSRSSCNGGVRSLRVAASVSARRPIRYHRKKSRQLAETLRP